MSKVRRGEIRRVQAAELKESPFSLSVYDPEPPPDFVASIKANGVLVPPVVDQNLTIISGHRRLRALKLLGLENVEVEVIDAQGSNFDLLVLEFNRQRVKTMTETLREAAEFEKRLRPLARERQRVGSKVPVQDSAKARIHVREHLEKFIGLSHDTLSKARFVEQHAPEFITQIDEKTMSVNGAYRETLKTLPPALSKPSRGSQLNLEQYRILYAAGVLLARAVGLKHPARSPASNWLKKGFIDTLDGKPPEIPIEIHTEAAIALCPLLAARAPEAASAAPTPALEPPAPVAEPATNDVPSVGLGEPQGPAIEVEDHDPQEAPPIFQPKARKRRRT